jgi:ketosteroid isomerase-like protein
MQTRPSPTLQIIQQFNQAFLQHDGSLLEDLIAEDCVMESVAPAPDGTRYVGRKACLEFWQNLANNRDGAFADEEITALGEHAIIRWRYRFGPGLSQSVRGVNVMRVRDGLIVEALGYVKSGEAAATTAVRNATTTSE